MKSAPHRELLALIALGVVSVAVLQILPMLVGGLIDHRGFTEAQAGYIASVEFGAIALSTLSAVYWLHRLVWLQVAAASMAVLLIGNFASIFINEFGYFVAIRGATGLASGCCMTLALTGIGQTARADRNFGLLVSAQLLFASVALWSLPYLFRAFGLSSAYVLLAVLAFVALVFLVRWMPDDRARVASEVNGRALIIWMPALFILGAVFSFNIAQGAFWAFLERIGIVGGLSPEQAGLALGIAALGGLSGALAATVVNTRFGRLLPVAAAMLAQVTVLVLLKGEIAVGMFIVLSAVFYFAWNMTIPYQFGLLAEFDRDGRAIVLCSFVVAAGLSIGPALAAQALTGGSYASINVLSGVFCILSFLLLLVPLAAIRTNKVAIQPSLTRNP